MRGQTPDTPETLRLKRDIILLKMDREIEPPVEAYEALGRIAYQMTRVEEDDA